MLALGLIFIVVAGILLVAAVTGGGHPATFDLGFVHGNTSTLSVFLIGAATVLIFVLGVTLTRYGIVGVNRRRQERKAYNQLAERLDQDNAAGTGTSATPGTTASPKATATAETTANAETKQTTASPETTGSTDSATSGETVPPTGEADATRSLPTDRP